MISSSSSTSRFWSQSLGYYSNNNPWSSSRGSLRSSSSSLSSTSSSLEAVEPPPQPLPNVGGGKTSASIFLHPYGGAKTWATTTTTQWQFWSVLMFLLLLLASATIPTVYYYSQSNTRFHGPALSPKGDHPDKSDAPPPPQSPSDWPAAATSRRTAPPFSWLPQLRHHAQTILRQALIGLEAFYGNAAPTTTITITPDDEPQRQRQPSSSSSSSSPILSKKEHNSISPHSQTNHDNQFPMLHVQLLHTTALTNEQKKKKNSHMPQERTSMRQSANNEDILVDRAASFPLNTLEAHDFETELFKGKILLYLMPATAAAQPNDSLPHVVAPQPTEEQHHHPQQQQQQYRILIQLQGQFKRQPKGMVYMGGEILHPMEMGPWTRRLANVLLRIVQGFCPGVVSSYGSHEERDDGSYADLPRIAVPAHWGFRRVHVTPAGQVPPPISPWEPFEENQSHRYHHHRSTTDWVWNTHDTYSLSFYTRFLHLAEWSILFPTTTHLSTFWGKSPLRLVMYEHNPNDELHGSTTTTTTTATPRMVQSEHHPHEGDKHHWSVPPKDDDDDDNNNNHDKTQTTAQSAQEQHHEHQQRHLQKHIQYHFAIQLNYLASQLGINPSINQIHEQEKLAAAKR